MSNLLMKMNKKDDLGSFEGKNPFSHHKACSISNLIQHQTPPKSLHEKNVSIEEFNIPTFEKHNPPLELKKYLHRSVHKIKKPSCIRFRA